MTDIIFTVEAGLQGDIGVVTLNRPQALNALSPTMLSALHQQLIDWEKCVSIKAVVVQATPGRAFCAGGDLRYIYENWHKPELGDYFKAEYALNTYIKHYSKPYIALIHGITMGGGAGLSINAHHCVAAPDLIFAMPEVSIGFFPDVGASYFLPRLPGFLGYYLALTGKSIFAPECLQAGLVQHIIERNNFSSVITALANTQFSAQDHEKINALLKSFAHAVTHQFVRHLATHFNQASVEAILKSLENCSDPEAHALAKLIQTKSPTSLKITLRALQLGSRDNFSTCLKREFNLAQCFLKNNDFYRGIKAILVEKTYYQDWQPRELSQVSTSKVEQYFLSA